MKFGLFLGLLTVILPLHPINADSPVEWLPAPTVDRPDFKSVKWTGSTFLVAGTNYIAESPTGEHWTPLDLTPYPEETYYRIVVGPQVLIVGRHHGLIRSETTPGNPGWESMTVPGDWRLGTLVFDGSRFLVVREDQSLHESTDGKTWQPVSGAPPLSFHLMVAGNGVLLGIDQENFYRSTDGLTWTAINQSEAVNEEGSTRYQPEISSLNFSGGQFVATMIRDLEYENNTYAVSTDGLTWTLADAPPYEVIEGDGDSTGFVDLVGGGGGPGETFGSNLDLDQVHLTGNGTPIVIHHYQLAINRALLGLDAGDASFLTIDSNPDGVVLAAGSDGLIARSTAPLNEYAWSEVGIQPAKINEARSDRQTIVAIWEDYDRLQQSRGSKGTVKYTRDGIVWEDVNLPDGSSQEFLSLDYVHNKWFLTEFQEALYTSNDGVNWSAADLVPITVLVDGFEEEYHPLAHLYGNGTYIGRGKSLGFQVDPYYDRTLPVARSSDGINWVPLAEEVRDVSAIAFGGGQFIALEADRGFRSSNGVTWEEFQINGLPGPPESLEYFRGRWVASRLPTPWGPPPFQMFSPNGKDWFPAKTSEDEEFPFPLDFTGLFEIFGVQFANLRMPAVSSSNHGLVWDVSEFISGQDFPFFVYDSITVPLGDRVVAVGDDFRLVRSQPITPAPSPQGINFIDTSHIEARIAPGLTDLEWQLQYSATLKPGEWIPDGDWKPVTEEDPFLFWKTAYQGDKGFFRLAFRVPF